MGANLGLLVKPETLKETQDGKGVSGCWAFGVSAMQGWRPSMEDAHIALPDFDTARQLGLFGVFDGHGGAAVARIVAERFPGMLRDLPAFQAGKYSEALYEAFLLLDAFLDSPDGRREVARVNAECSPAAPTLEEYDDETLERLVKTGDIDPNELGLPGLLGEEGEEEELQSDEELCLDEGEEEEEDDESVEANNAWVNGEGPDGMGCTAVVALVCGGKSPELIVANAGDSRCVLARGKRALGMSRDHKPTLKVERRRIKKAGGFVNNEGRVDGNLNLSRALGDFAYKKDTNLKATEQKISCEAEIRSKSLTPADRYVVLGCDGIFEKMTNQALVDFLLPQLLRRTRRHPPLSTVCSAFLDENVAKNPSKEQGLGCDNMTLMVVDLFADGSRVVGHGVQKSNPRKKGLALMPFGGPRRETFGILQSIRKDKLRRKRSPGLRRLQVLTHWRLNLLSNAATSVNGR